ncbi:MAG: ribose-phosphate diphosphokinase, partial [Verrucomicrobiota bacterium]
HSILLQSASARLRAVHIDAVSTSNSVPLETRGLPITVRSIAPLLADAIRRIHGNSSVTDLFPIKGH